MQNDIIPGFYGKLPSTGDFVSRRLPSDFIKFWDQWLQEALYMSKNELGPHFKECYKSAPIWRFVLGPDCCGGYNVAGIMTPSWDKVERFYPLTIAVIAEIPLFHLIVRAAQWFSQLEVLVGLLLQGKMDLKRFDNNLQQLRLPSALFKNNEYMHEDIVCPADDPLYFRVDMRTLHQIPEALEHLMAHLLRCQLASYSMWVGKSTINSNIALAVFRSLPPPDGYIRFLASPTNNLNLK